MTVFAVLVRSAGGYVKISQDAYKSLEDAQSFCRSRGDSPMQFSSHSFKSSTYRYEIYELDLYLKRGDTY